MKVSDRLHSINGGISLQCMGLKQLLSLKQLEQLNKELGQIIQDVRQLEKTADKYNNLQSLEIDKLDMEYLSLGLMLIETELKNPSIPVDTSISQNKVKNLKLKLNNLKKEKNKK